MSLFAEIGGEGAVNAAVDIFYGKVLKDDRIKHFFDGVKQLCFLVPLFPNTFFAK